MKYLYFHYHGIISDNNKMCYNIISYNTLYTTELIFIKLLNIFCPDKVLVKKHYIS